MDLANQGKLQTRADVRTVVEQIWDNEGVDKPRTRRFFHEFFGYHAAETVFKGDRATATSDDDLMNNRLNGTLLDFMVDDIEAHFDIAAATLIAGLTQECNSTPD